MKKVITTLIICLSLLININVFACAEMKNLNISNATITKKSETEYDAIIKPGVSTVKIEADTDYKWVSGFEPRTVSTNSPVKLRVDGNPECGINTYTINFVVETEKTTTPSTTTTTTKAPVTPTVEEQSPQETVDSEILPILSDLSITGYDLNFNPDNKVYELNVNYEVTSVEINVSKEKETDTVTISENANELIVGQNNITITVTNSENISATYELMINRKSDKSNNNYLSALIVSGYSIGFDPNTFEYTLTIKNEKTLTIVARTQDENATYILLNNNDLKNGSLITIRVTAEDETERDYTINIIKEFNILDFVMDNLRYFIAGLVALVLLIIIIIVINKKKRKKSEPSPETIETQETTAGEIAIPTANTNIETNPQSNNNIQANQIQSSILEIIEPTNVESTNKQQKNQGDTSASQESNSNTEVFKL